MLELILDRQGQMTADLSNGNVYWTSGNNIWKYDASSNLVSTMYQTRQKFKELQF